MKLRISCFIGFALLTIACSSKPIQVITATSPEDLIEKYMQLEQQFNTSIVTLYSDNANIQNRRLYPDGQTKVLTLKAVDYKNLMIKAMPIAKLRKDTNTYTNIVFKKTNGRVEVTADRYSNLKKYTSPISWILEKGSNSNWLITEEISESRP